MKINKEYIMTGIFFVLLFICGFFASYSFFKSHFDKEVDTPESIDYNTQFKNLTDTIIEDNIKLNITQDIYNSCYQLENITEKFYCVGDFFTKNYKYVPTTDFYSIDEMFDKGADCKSFSVYYATLANMMGYDYIFLTINNHMFTIAYDEENYCLLDVWLVRCVNFEQ